MVKRGSITVFLALTLGLILSLLSSGLESVRMAAARTQILNGMDVGLYLQVSDNPHDPCRQAR